VGRRTALVAALYLLIIVLFMWLGFGNDTTTNIFFIFTSVPVFILAVILITEFFVEMNKRQRQNPYLTPSALVERAQNPEEWIEKIMHEIENGTISEVPVSPPSKGTLFRRKAETFSASIIIPSTVLISLIYTYIFSQLNPGTYKLQFWAEFSIMSLVFLTIGYVWADIFEKRRLVSQSEETIQQGFELPKRNVRKSLDLGCIILSITVLTLVYLYLTSPKEVWEYLFMLNSPIFILFVILGILSIFFITVGIIMRVRNVVRMRDSGDHDNFSS